MPAASIGKQPLSMLAALLIRTALVARVGLAADSHSCRDQREPGSAGARVFQPMRGSGPGIEIPPYAITRGSASASPQQVISLGDTKWTQEILRPMSVVSQSETTTTKQHNYKTTPDGGKGTGAAEQGPGADPSREDEQERRRPAAAGAPPPPDAAAAGREGEEQEEGTAQQVVSPSSLLSQPGPQAAGRPRGNPRPPSDSGTHIADPCGGSSGGPGDRAHGCRRPGGCPCEAILKSQTLVVSTIPGGMPCMRR